MKTSRRNFLRKTTRNSLAALSAGPLAATATELLASPLSVTNETANAPKIKPDHLVKSVPEHMVWGFFGADVPPIYRVKDGDVVEIQTVNPSG